MNICFVNVSMYQPDTKICIADMKNKYKINQKSKTSNRFCKLAIDPFNHSYIVTVTDLTVSSKLRCLCCLSVIYKNYADLDVSFLFEEIGSSVQLFVLFYLCVYNASFFLFIEYKISLFQHSVDTPSNDL